MIDNKYFAHAVIYCTRYYRKTNDSTHTQFKEANIWDVNHLPELQKVHFHVHLK